MNEKEIKQKVLTDLYYLGTFTNIMKKIDPDHEITLDPRIIKIRVFADIPKIQLYFGVQRIFKAFYEYKETAKNTLKYLIDDNTKFYIDLFDYPEMDNIHPDDENHYMLLVNEKGLTQLIEKSGIQDFDQLNQNINMILQSIIEDIIK